MCEVGQGQNTFLHSQLFKTRAVWQLHALLPQQTLGSYLPLPGIALHGGDSTQTRGWFAFLTASAERGTAGRWPLQATRKHKAQLQACRSAELWLRGVLQEKTLLLHWLLTALAPRLWYSMLECHSPKSESQPSARGRAAHSVSFPLPGCKKWTGLEGVKDRPAGCPLGWEARPAVWWI